jgi:hypothetical protein
MSFFNIWILLTSALMAPQGTLFHNATMMPVNNQQNILLSKYKSLQRDTKYFTSDELQAWASTDNNELNEIARENGIPISFSPFADGKFGSLSILSLDLKWLQKPELNKILFETDEGAKRVQGLEFNKHVSIYKSRCHKYPVVRIKTRTGDYLWLTVATEQLQGFELSKKIKHIKKNMNSLKRANHSSVIMPQISFEGFVDISWMEGLRIADKRNEYAIDSAIEYVKLACDQEGCSVKAGAGLEFIPVSVVPDYHPPLIIDQPFYFWIERAQCKHPIVEAYIDYDSLKKI